MHETNPINSGQKHQKGKKQFYRVEYVEIELNFDFCC